MGFIVAFNPGLPAWHINTSNPVWQIVRWTLWRSPIMRLYGYDTYVTVMYVMAAIVLVSHAHARICKLAKSSDCFQNIHTVTAEYQQTGCAVQVAVLGLVWLTLAMRKTEQAKWLRHAALALHVLFDVVFMMCYISFFDFFVFMANCNFGAVVKHHMYFQGVSESRGLVIDGSGCCLAPWRRMACIRTGRLAPWSGSPRLPTTRVVRHVAGWHRPQLPHTCVLI